MGKLTEEIRALLKEVPEIDVVAPKPAPSIPIAAKKMHELAMRVISSWSKAYGAAEPPSGFVKIKYLGTDILETFGLWPKRKARTPGGSVKAEKPDIRNLHENELLHGMHYAATNAKHGFEKEVVHRGADLKAEAEAIAEAADAAQSLSDPALTPLVALFADKFIPWVRMTGSHVYRPVTTITQNAEVLASRFLPPDEQLPAYRPSGSGKQRSRSAFASSQELAEAARQFARELEDFRRITEHTIGEIMQMANLADEVVSDLPPSAKYQKMQSQPEEPEGEVMEARSVGRPSKKRKWIPIPWDNDPDFD